VEEQVPEQRKLFGDAQAPPRIYDIEIIQPAVQVRLVPETEAADAAIPSENTAEAGDETSESL
jgi:hypothetical protein